MDRLAEESTRDLPVALVALINQRISIVNGCVYCLVTHGEQARAAGIEQRVLDTLPAWRESPLFTPAERAALELADAVTELGPHGVPDDVYAEAAAPARRGRDGLAAADRDRDERVEPHRHQHRHGSAGGGVTSEGSSPRLRP